MTPKEALEEIKDTFIHNEYGESRGSSYDYGIELYKKTKQALTELEKLKRDVARYFELEEQDTFNSQEEYDEYGILYDKLSKVGKEE